MSAGDSTEQKDVLSAFRHVIREVAVDGLPILMSVLPIVSIVVPFFWLNESYIKDPKR